MADIKNKPRISRWIGRFYILLTILIAVLYTTIALQTNIPRFLYAGIFFTMLMVAILLLIGVIAYGFYKTKYVIRNGFLYSWSPFAIINLKLNNITKIEQTRVPFYFKGMGASFYSGIFYIPSLGWAKVIITNFADGVLITDKNGKHYLITPSNPDAFAKSLSRQQ